jgi:hypothetical protein
LCILEALVLSAQKLCFLCPNNSGFELILYPEDSQRLKCSETYFCIYINTQRNTFRQIPILASKRKHMKKRNKKMENIRRSKSEKKKSEKQYQKKT